MMESVGANDKQQWQAEKMQMFVTEDCRAEHRPF